MFGVQGLGFRVPRPDVQRAHRLGIDGFRMEGSSLRTNPPFAATNQVHSSLPTLLVYQGLGVRV